MRKSYLGAPSCHRGKMTVEQWRISILACFGVSGTNWYFLNRKLKQHKPATCLLTIVFAILLKVCIIYIFYFLILSFLLCKVLFLYF
ncbi:hypothetical protein EAKF1_ch4332 [Escherichia albertii KF1]|nr:hypothetical protein EAKF1_ch4332 [Escherichia albertii KF1]